MSVRRLLVVLVAGAMVASGRMVPAAVSSTESDLADAGFVGVAFEEDWAAVSARIQSLDNANIAEGGDGEAAPSAEESAASQEASASGSEEAPASASESASSEDESASGATEESAAASASAEEESAAASASGAEAPAPSSVEESASGAESSASTEVSASSEESASGAASEASASSSEASASASAGGASEASGDESSSSVSTSVSTSASGSGGEDAESASHSGPVKVEKLLTDEEDKKPVVKCPEGEPNCDAGALQANNERLLDKVNQAPFDPNDRDRKRFEEHLNTVTEPHPEGNGMYTVLTKRGGHLYTVGVIQPSAQQIRDDRKGDVEKGDATAAAGVAAVKKAKPKYGFSADVSCLETDSCMQSNAIRKEE